MYALYLRMIFRSRRPFFFFNDTATTEIYTLSLHDALPIYTIVIRTPTNAKPPRPAWAEDTLALETSWKPRSFYEQGRDVDMLSPVIDLDAALGPFNTPEMESDRVVASGFSAATKRMYSGGRRGEFVGP